MTRNLRKYINIALLLLSSYLVFSCANMASPSGGAYDYDPPKVVKITPGFNAEDVKKGKIVIHFDELIKLDNPADKIIVTPPQHTTPSIQAVGKKLTVQLKDSLLPNTTYTVDFTDAVEDNNEGNALENFSVTFSTGSVIDSLAISGKVLSADNLEPVKGIYVGLHSNLNDSAFVTLPFDRISRTNDQGFFSIKGVAAGKYKIYALNDLNRAYMYVNPSEDVAFLDSIIVPSHVKAMRTDTIYDYSNIGLNRPKKKKKKDGQEEEVAPPKDSLQQVEYTRFLPDNIVLRSFVSNFRRLYLKNSERKTDDFISIYFSAPIEMPYIVPLNFDRNRKWGLLERNVTNDTIHYWITDSVVAKMDTIQFKVSYQKTDSLNHIFIQTDTLKLVNRKRKSQEKEREKKIKQDVKDQKKNKEPLIEFLKINTSLNGVWDLNKAIFLEFPNPLMDFDTSKIHLEHLIDTTYVAEQMKITVDSLNPRKVRLAHKWIAGDSYRLAIDSATLHAYNGLWNNAFKNDFKIKTLDQYGQLFITIKGLPEGKHAFVELLNSSDAPVRKSFVKNNGVTFLNLNPGKYYARLVIDDNDNGKWDTGDYDNKQQPEMVYYYPRYWDIKAYFDYGDEVWDLHELPLDKQKPLTITKNKPKKRLTKKQKMEQREKK